MDQSVFCNDPTCTGLLGNKAASCILYMLIYDVDKTLVSVLQHNPDLCPASRTPACAQHPETLNANAGVRKGLYTYVHCIQNQHAKAAKDSNKPAWVFWAYTVSSA
jgi:hypothetical protein